MITDEYINLSIKKYKRKVARCLKIVEKDALTDKFTPFGTAHSWSECQVLLLGNVGHTTGHDETDLLEQLTNYIAVEGLTQLLIPPGKHYSYALYDTPKAAQIAMDNIINILTGQGHLNNISKDQHYNISSNFKCVPIYASLVANVPVCHTTCHYLPHGLKVCSDFVSIEEERMLMNLVSWDENLSNEELGNTLRHRQVRHFGYQFQYGSNSIDIRNPLLSAPIPQQLQPVIQRMMEQGIVRELPDQVTVNRYVPGQGIPPHTDSHAACTEELVSLSLGSAVVMDFTLNEVKSVFNELKGSSDNMYLTETKVSLLKETDSLKHSQVQDSVIVQESLLAKESSGDVNSFMEEPTILIDSSSILMKHSPAMVEDTKAKEVLLKQNTPANNFRSLICSSKDVHISMENQQIVLQRNCGDKRFEANIIKNNSERQGIHCSSRTLATNSNSTVSHCAVLLPARSLCVMTGEARYCWRHGIRSRRTDAFHDAAGRMKLMSRGLRVSYTFRKTRDKPCCCQFPGYCNSRKNAPVSPYESRVDASRGSVQDLAANAAAVEARHVQAVYENIAPHFSDTRHKPWPNVQQFVCSLIPGSVMLDVGCGNGKYLGLNRNIVEVGCDSSAALLSIVQDRGHQALQGHCLTLPCRSDSCDAVICIAVLHHLASQDRRVAALREIVRVLRVDGQALVYVWALEQTKAGKHSAYIKQNKNTRKQGSIETDNKEERSCNVEEPEIGNLKVSSSAGVCRNVVGRLNLSEEIVGSSLNSACFSADKTNSTATKHKVHSLPVHENRTHFTQQDVLVPWKLKTKKKYGEKIGATAIPITSDDLPVFHRFYHTFQEGELEKICCFVDNLKIIKSYYDEGNWCIQFKKII